MLFASPASARAPADALPRGALRSATSLYLKEAASSPIKWQPWGEAAFALARKLNRPVLLDIGAVWCHWCHVMDGTTYADPEVATLVNRSFVPIKVDADERPDIDGYYQDAGSRLAGAGGWPLTCFTTPTGALFLVFGYMPPRAESASASHPGAPGMATVLNRVAQVWATQREQLEKETAEAAAALSKEPPAGARGKIKPESLRSEILSALATSYDAPSGGFGRGEAPRFYDFAALELALAHGFFGHREFTALALESLRKIVRGGVYDQLGGGFHRYSTDPRWRVPHFEKMGYDQAMALDTYARAFEASGDEGFARICRGILGYVGSELMDPVTHTFYSHQDADAFLGDDGSYYTWTVEEVSRALKPETARAAILYFGMQDDPARAPDGRIVLRRALSLDELAARLKVSRDQAQALVGQAIEAMRAAREKRRHPKVDRALLVDRNALMAAAYLTAAAALKDETLKRIALDDLDYIMAHAKAPDGSFYHVVADSKAAVAGLLADQVYMLNAMLAAYQAAREARYLERSRALAELILKSFRDPTTSLLRDRAAGEPGTALGAPVVSANVLYDRPMPSPQGTMAQAMLELGAITSESRWARVASELLAAAPARANPRAASILATLGLALEAERNGDTVVAIVGAEDDRRSQALLGAALSTYRPGKVVMMLDRAAKQIAQLPQGAQSMLKASGNNKQPIAFVCAKEVCANPVSTPESLTRLMREFGLPPSAGAGAS